MEPLTPGVKSIAASPKSARELEKEYKRLAEKAKEELEKEPVSRSNIIQRNKSHAY